MSLHRPAPTPSRPAFFGRLSVWPAAGALAGVLAGCANVAPIDRSEVARFGSEANYNAALRKCNDEELAKLKARSVDNYSSVPKALMDECMKRQAAR